MYKTIFGLWAAFLLANVLEGQSLLGFSDTQAAQKQLTLEQQFDQGLNAKNLDTWMKKLAGRPHHIGSPYGKENAEYMAALFRSWGYQATIEEYQVLMPYPKARVLELVAPTVYKAGLAEPKLKEDATSGQTAEQLPTYNCYSADGNVTAELVFVNYGIPEDYEELARRGIDVKGKIVIAKYGRSWRGIKPKVAQEHGAVGCLIYSDPREDGYFEGDVYPKGPFRNEFGVQRGSVLDMPMHPGDPLTPGQGATAEARRLDRSEAVSLLKIPVLPISYKDAQPLLAALEGPVAPAAWRGALPITYHIGPGPAKVHLQLSFEWALRPAYDVIAKWPGSEYPDEWIIRGNHHDAWVNGAADPISGMVALMEEARMVAELAKAGNPPKRTLVYCGWDGEEPGLLGSTEWAEHHAAELKQKAVAYINSDGNGRGYLYAQGSHSLEAFFEEISKAVPDPQKGISVFERRRSQALVSDGTDMKNLSLGALGSGSDYSPFVQHLGIPALNIGFGGEDDGGEYHSIYDSYDLYVRFKDTNFEYGVALAKVGGRSALRLANADVLPFEYRRFFQTVSGYADEVVKLAEQSRKKIERENKLITEGHYANAADPTQKFVVPQIKKEAPYLNFAPLQNAIALLDRTTNKYPGGGKYKTTDTALLNKRLPKLEQSLTREAGLPGRPWYKHHIYAPGFYTGYGVKTLPGVREAIEQNQWELAQQQIAILAEVIERFCADLEKAAEGK